MKLRFITLITILLCAAILSACTSDPTQPGAATDSQTGFSPPTANGVSYWIPPLHASWQIQFTGITDTSLDVDIYILDLFDVPSEVINELHDRGIKVICYFSAGTYENWRPDAGQFPANIIGNELPEWPGEQWLDIRSLEALAPIMLGRINLAVQKGCDGLDPDNVDGYANNTGFPLTPEDQLAYNIFLANAAHQNGLAIGLKNDLQQVPELTPFFDWGLNEECFTYQECGLLLPFVQAGKPVFVIEYQLPPEQFCPQANEMDFNALQKTLQLDAFRYPCR